MWRTMAASISGLGCRVAVDSRRLASATIAA